MGRYVERFLRWSLAYQVCLGLDLSFEVAALLPGILNPPLEFLQPLGRIVACLVLNRGNNSFLLHRRETCLTSQAEFTDTDFHRRCGFCSAGFSPQLRATGLRSETPGLGKYTN